MERIQFTNRVQIRDSSDLVTKANTKESTMATHTEYLLQNSHGQETIVFQ